MQLIHDHPLPATNLASTPIGARLIDLHSDGTVSTELLWLPATSPGDEAIVGIT